MALSDSSVATVDGGPFHSCGLQVQVEELQSSLRSQELMEAVVIRASLDEHESEPARNTACGSLVIFRLSVLS